LRGPLPARIGLVFQASFCCARFRSGGKRERGLIYRASFGSSFGWPGHASPSCTATNACLKKSPAPGTSEEGVDLFEERAIPLRAQTQPVLYPCDTRTPICRKKSKTRQKRYALTCLGACPWQLLASPEVSRRELCRAAPVDAGILVLMSDLSTILSALNRGDRIAAEKLLPLVYDELRKLATQRMAQERPGQTLNATALVHEAYLRLVKDSEAANWDGRGHFFAAAAEAMRRILVENARRKNRLKHGGQRRRVSVADVAREDDESRVLALDDALTRLAAEDRQAAKVVEMHHFGGLSHEIVAESLGLTVYRVRQKWTYARAWLRDDLHP
jgi:RNA polymerase sigma factor (TIGR02999 family)